MQVRVTAGELAEVGHRPHGASGLSAWPAIGTWWMLDSAARAQHHDGHDSRDAVDQRPSVSVDRRARHRTERPHAQPITSGVERHIGKGRIQSS
jgi:hypothetical protein